MGDALDTSDLRLDGVSSRDELAGRLREVHVRADRPSLRTLEARTRHDATPLSKTAVAEMLKGVRLPRKTVMVAFLRACGVQDDNMAAWQRAWDRAASGTSGLAHRREASLWYFPDSGSITLICAELPVGEKGQLADPSNPNYTELLSYADVDSLMELYGHIRAVNPAMDVHYTVSSRFSSDDLSSHVVLVGGIGWNEITERISEMSRMPIRQVRDPAVDTGEIFVADRNGKEQRFLPRWSPGHHELIEDIGLLARTPNPFNSNRSLTICNGIHSRGVLGAVRALTDPGLRESNERYINEKFADSSAFAVLMQVSVIGGRTITPDLHAAGCVLYEWPPG